MYPVLSSPHVRELEMGKVALVRLYHLCVATSLVSFPCRACYRRRCFKRCCHRHGHCRRHRPLTTNTPLSSSVVGKALAAGEVGVLVRAAGACFKSRQKFSFKETEKVRKKPKHGVVVGGMGA